MFNKHFRKDKHFSSTGFRYRGVESSRIEHLTDAVFAFSITLLVIAAEVPKTYVELQASMYNFIGFIACTLLLLGIWSNHAAFFLNYGMQDRVTKILNFLFLFVLLFYIYPLKYLFSHLSNIIFINLVGKENIQEDVFEIVYQQAISSRLSFLQYQDLMIRFGLGLFFIYLILGFMHINALRSKVDLELNEQEEYETKFHIRNYSFLCCVCITSMIVVWLTGGKGSGISGCVYLLIPTVLPFLKKSHLKKLKKKFPESFKGSVEEKAVIITTESEQEAVISQQETAEKEVRKTTKKKSETDKKSDDNLGSETASTEVKKELKKKTEL